MSPVSVRNPVSPARVPVRVIAAPAPRHPFLPEWAFKMMQSRFEDMIALLMLGFALAAALALASHHPGDVSFNTASSVAEIQNRMGRYGANFADMALQMVGAAAFLLPFALAMRGLDILRRKKYDNGVRKTVDLAVAIFLSSLALASLFPDNPAWGGSLGQILTRHLGNVIGDVASVAAGRARMAVSMITACAAIPFLLSALNLGQSRLNFLARFAGYLMMWLGAMLWRAVSAPFRKTAEISQAETETVDILADADPLKPESPRKTLQSKTVRNNEAIGAFVGAKIAKVKNPPAKPRKKADDGQSAMDLGGGLRQGVTLPPAELMQMPPISRGEGVDEAVLSRNLKTLLGVLADFGVKGEIRAVHPGPVVSLYELEPAPGTKSSRVIGLADDIARSMSAISVRVAVIPGRNAIGIELPNARRETVYMREMLEDETYRTSAMKLALALGKDIGGRPVNADLARMPHLLVAGTTGSGKSVAVNSFILSLLYRLSPAQCRFIMIDPKMLELSVYDGIPHLLTPVVTDPRKAVVALKWAVREMEDRYRAMSKLGVRNIDGYNARLAEARANGEVLTRRVQTGFDPESGKPVFEDQPLDLTELPYIVIIVDEFADLMLVAGKDVEGAVQRLAQMARAAGLHLIMATQRPSVDVITGTIKANFPTRISFAVSSKIDSRTILNEGGAETLLGQGDMLYMAAGGRVTRVHGPFVSDNEVEKVVAFLKTQGEPVYIEDITAGGEEDEDGGKSGSFGDGGSDPYDQAVQIVLRDRKASTSYIQRQLRIGYNSAARLIEQMEREGIVSEANHVGKREILVGGERG